MTIRTVFRSLVAALLPVVAIVSSGCDASKPPAGTVAGTVSYNGSAVIAGTVNFISPTGSAAQGNIDESGTYKVDSPLQAGEYKVYVSPPLPTPGPPGKRAAAPPKFVVPQKYRDPATTPAKAVVKAGTNEIPIELKD
jgi:hypothetical protein